MEKYDNNIEVDEYGFTSYKYGFNIYGDSEEVESLFALKMDITINKEKKKRVVLNMEEK